ncbi:MAG: GWxTD domain-containing protein [Candidatus Neomarinimicrobiota bacterium]
MKLKNLFILLILACVSPSADGPRDRTQRQNVDQFRLAALPIAVTAGDSIQVLTYLEIPNAALQFLKSDSGFQAEFEAAVAISQVDGDHQGRFIWSGAVDVVDYQESISGILYTTLTSTLTMPAGKFELNAEVLDKDTKQTGKQMIELDLSGYNADLFLFPLTILKKKPGNWGLADDYIPIFANKIPMDNENYRLMVGGRVNPVNYSLHLQAVDNIDSVLWNDTQTYANSATVINHILQIPTEILKGLNVKVTARLSQNSKEISQTITIQVSHPGISSTINNLEEAIEQMTYILNDAEQREFKTTKKNQREKLFHQYWEKRDPTPNTLKNEMMDEYYRRVWYANQNFSSFMPGWRSDMGMIYILFGPPDDIERQNNSTTRYSSQRWTYYSINRSFIFVDQSGFGDYRLATPYLGRSGL